MQWQPQGIISLCGTQIGPPICAWALNIFILMTWCLVFILCTLFMLNKWINGMINPNISCPWYCIGVLVCFTTCSSLHKVKGEGVNCLEFFGLCFHLIENIYFPTHPPNNNLVTTCYHMVNSNGQFHHMQFGIIFRNSLSLTIP